MKFVIHERVCTLRPALPLLQVVWWVPGREKEKARETQTMLLFIYGYHIKNK